MCQKGKMWSVFQMMVVPTVLTINNLLFQSGNIDHFVFLGNRAFTLNFISEIGFCNCHIEKCLDYYSIIFTYIPTMLYNKYCKQYITY